MGVEYRGQLCIGYSQDELNDLVTINKHMFEGVDTDDMSSREKAEVFGFGSYAPYYDADMADRIYGWTIARSDDYSATKITLDRFKKIDQMTQEMIDEFGLVPSVYIMAEGT